MGDSEVCDPLAEVERLKNVIAKLEGQNKQLRQKSSDFLFSDLQTDATSGNGIHIVDHENGNVDSNIAYSASKHKNGVKQIQRPTFLASPSASSGSKEVDLDSIDIIDVSVSASDPDESWLYESPSPVSPGGCTPQQWLKKDSDSPKSSSVRRTLAYRLDELTRSPRSGGASGDSSHLNSSLARLRQRQEQLAQASAASPITPDLVASAATRDGGGPTVRNLKFGSSPRGVDSRTFTRPKKQGPVRTAAATPPPADEGMAHDIDEIKLLARMQEESLRASMTQPRKPKARKDSMDSQRSSDNNLESSTSSIASTRSRESLGVGGQGELGASAGSHGTYTVSPPASPDSASPYGSHGSLDHEPPPSHRTSVRQTRADSRQQQQPESEKGNPGGPMRRSLPNLRSPLGPTLSLPQARGMTNRSIDGPGGLGRQAPAPRPAQGSRLNPPSSSGYGRMREPARQAPEQQQQQQIGNRQGGAGRLGSPAHAPRLPQPASSPALSRLSGPPAPRPSVTASRSPARPHTAQSPRVRDSTSPGRRADGRLSIPTVSGLRQPSPGRRSNSAGRQAAGGSGIPGALSTPPRRSSGIPSGRVARALGKQQDDSWQDGCY